jgi:pimeloyl-ACP methyl ester carboxylesterase
MSRSKLLFALLAIFFLIGWSSPAAADQRTDRIVSALGSGAQVVDVVSTDEWTWTKIDLTDADGPRRVDVVASNRCDDDGRVLFMFPAAGLNFEANYFTPRETSLATFMRKRGYLVIGVGSRADFLPATANDPAIGGWGATKLRDDAHDVITKIQRVTRREFDLLGHSLGAFQALDYAATYPDDPEQVFILDVVGAYDPVTEPTLVSRAQATASAYQTLIDQGKVVVNLTPGVKQVIAAATLFPSADSQVPRTPFLGPSFPGDFTFLSLLDFSLVYATELPGDITPLTGLPALWFIQALVAGTYAPNPDPLLDTGALTNIPFPVLSQAFMAAGSGDVPVAQLRDEVQVFGGGGPYTIPFENIRAKVNWVNAGLGLGSHPQTARLIAAARHHHHQRVRYSVIDGYGHADVALGANAARDVWSVLVGE